MSFERPDDLLTVRQAARRCAVDVETVRRWIRKGAMVAVTVGPFRVVKVTRAEVEKHIQVYVPK